MSEKIIEANDTDFDEITREGTVLVDFWASWCAPCRMQSKILHDLTDKLPDNVKIVKVNVDSAQNTAGRFNVRSIPTVVIMNDGEVSKQMVGVQDEDTILQAVS